MGPDAVRAVGQPGGPVPGRVEGRGVGELLTVKDRLDLLRGLIRQTGLPGVLLAGAIRSISRTEASKWRERYECVSFL